MLILTVNEHQDIVTDGPAVFKILSSTKNKVQVGIEAPETTRITRVKKVRVDHPAEDRSDTGKLTGTVLVGDRLYT